MSYDFITPTAAAGILKSIYWKPEMDFLITAIEILKPIRWSVHTCNERKGGKGESRLRTQRSSRILVDVAYVIRASIITANAKDANKHLAMFQRRASKGQSFRQPNFGMNEYPVGEFRLATRDHVPCPINHDFGYMIRSIDYNNGRSPIPFRAIAVNGVVSL